MACMADSREAVMAASGLALSRVQRGESLKAAFSGQQGPRKLGKSSSAKYIWGKSQVNCKP